MPDQHVAAQNMNKRDRAQNRHELRLTATEQSSRHIAVSGGGEEVAAHQLKNRHTDSDILFGPWAHGELNREADRLSTSTLH